MLVEWTSEEATGRLVTDDSSRFTLRLALPGTVRLRVLRLGFRPELLPPQPLARAEMRSLRHILHGSGVTLAPMHHRIEGLGGELRFAELPSGLWILQQWEIRMPRLSGWSSSERRAVGLWAEGRLVSCVRRAGR